MIEFQKSDSIQEIASALVNFRSIVPKVVKNRNGFNYRYADLSAVEAAIKKPLEDCGLAVTQFPSGENCLVTLLMHTSGEWMMCEYHMEPAKKDPQSFGSVITYMRRYALGAVLGLDIDEDDDAEAVSEKEVAAPKRFTPPATPRQIPPGVPYTPPNDEF
jgi:hypothetical protein